MARERLQLVLRQQRGLGAGGPIVNLALLQARVHSPYAAPYCAYLPTLLCCTRALQEELCTVLMKHVDHTDPSDVSVSVRREGVLDVFEMQVTLPMSEAQ